MRHAGLPLAAAADRALAALAPLASTGGLIAVGADGSVATPFTTAGMPRAWRIGDQPTTAAIDGLRTTPLRAPVGGVHPRTGQARAGSSAQGGDRETAARVAKLPKPTPAAWTANQIAREHPDVIATLLDAGAALRAAQDAALAGGGAEQLRAATQAERRAVEAVMQAAADLKPGGKPLSRAMADRLRTTLHAAAGDPELRAALADGRLVGRGAGRRRVAVRARHTGTELPGAQARRREATGR